jgi:hypothetical protein
MVTGVWTAESSKENPLQQTLRNYDGRGEAIAITIWGLVRKQPLDSGAYTRDLGGEPNFSHFGWVEDDSTVHSRFAGDEM